MAWSMRTFLILPAYSTELELLCKEILNLDIKEGRLITLGKCQFISDVLKRRLGTRPMSKVWSEIQSRLVPASPVTGWKVSLELGAAARQESNVSAARTVLEQSRQGSSAQVLLNAISY